METEVTSNFDLSKESEVIDVRENSRSKQGEKAEENNLLT